ncbi:hypothetical protein SAMN05216371_2168 [Streptomyces sp. TLI_053]|uniref:hypothetical protein n=1 Tax=Streptomyces sp. TLI_053 TaxID=1855352 RepID=UPI00087BD17C|nr:hypothetical protein [Streptomyces sp. TLI_053]SDT40270.1 hypothetical protein SAMN05216371_2168 [Streptomyces sp. TLI_053]
MAARSIGTPARTAAVKLAAGAVALGCLALSGCTAARSDVPGTDGATRAAQPVKSRDEAMGRVTQVLEHLREAAVGQGGPVSQNLGYYRCEGPDIAGPTEPYVLSSATSLDVPADGRVAIVRRLRDALRDEGLSISGYKEPAATPSPTPSPDANGPAAGTAPGASFRAASTGGPPGDRYLVAVEERSDKGIMLMVSTACLTPPDALRVPPLVPPLVPPTTKVP